MDRLPPAHALEFFVSHGSAALLAGPEPVANPCLGQDVVWLSWILLELLAQLAHVDPEVLHVHLRTPDLLHDHALGEHLAGVDDEEAQDVPFLVREPYLRTAHRHEPARQVNDEVPALEYGLGPL